MSQASGRVTHTKSIGKGTFEQAAEQIQCPFDGTVMKTPPDNYPNLPRVKVLMCPHCGNLQYFRTS
jgi:hypothetical protein